MRRGPAHKGAHGVGGGRGEITGHAGQPPQPAVRFGGQAQKVFPPGTAAAGVENRGHPAGYGYSGGESPAKR